MQAVELSRRKKSLAVWSEATLIHYGVSSEPGLRGELPV
jgi:hypothetical protein